MVKVRIATNAAASHFVFMMENFIVNGLLLIH